MHFPLNTQSILAAFALSLPCAGTATATPETAPGDRNPPVNQIYPPEAFHHNGKGGRVLDVTKPPSHAKGDGVTDDTQALSAAMRFVRDHYEALEGEGVGAITGQKWGAACYRKLRGTWTIYLPDGKYLVSDTVSQGWPALAFNIRNGWWNVNRVLVNSPEHEKELDPGYYSRGIFDGALIYGEWNYDIQIVGQSRNKTVIQLKDSSPGFGEGEAKAVVSYYLLQRGSNCNVGNFIQNLTIETGNGNPGAVGLKWNSSNWGGVRNLAIRSGDGLGRAGLMMGRNNALGYHHDLLVEGFDVGIELTAGRETTVALEYATLSGQRKTAIRVGGTGIHGADCLSARKILTRDAPLAFSVGEAGHVVLLESELTTKKEEDAAMVVERDGHLFARDISLSGYRSAVLKGTEVALKGASIREFVSDAPVSLNPDGSPQSMRLPVKDWPMILPETDLSKWASVTDFGAVGDGLTDDTAAIQRAMASGKPVVYFPKANYVINGTVNIPATVREVSCMWAGIYRSEASEPDGPAMFRVAEPLDQPLLVRQTVTGGGVFLDHDADRTVVLQDVIPFFHHARNWAQGPDMLFPGPAAQNTGVWRSYRNSRPDGATKEVFVNNCMYFAPGGIGKMDALENVRAWVRMVDNEHVPGAQFAFRRSEVWILGFKTENSKTLFQVEDKSRVEVLGGTFLSWEPNQGPLVISRDSLVSMTFYIWFVVPEIIFQDDTKGVITSLPAARLPVVGRKIPGYPEGHATDAAVPLLVNFPQ